MSTKPDYNYTKELISRADEIVRSLRASLDAQRGEIAAVRSSADAFYEERLRSALEELDIDILSQGKQGIRVSSLRNAGVNNIYQLSKMSRPRIEAMEGIGAQGAKTIFETSQKIVENTKNKLSVRINVDSPKKTDDALLAALYILVIHEPLRAQMKQLYKDSHVTLQNMTKNVKSATSGFKWFFTSKSKKESTLNATAELESYLSDNFGEGSDYYIYTSSTTADITEARAHFRENSAVYYSTLEKHCKHLNTAEPEATGLSADLLREIEAQVLDLKYLKATLRSYQNFGVKYVVHQKRTLLGDEMGLGKTMQAIAAMAALKAEGKNHFMVVCPASVLINWCREIEKFSLMAVTKIHGADEEALLHWRMNGDVAVTTYESISRFSLPEKFRFDMLVVDEAHYVKNPEAQRTVAMMKLLEKTDSLCFDC